MSKSKKYSYTVLDCIVELSNRGLSSRKIAEVVGVSKSFVNHFLKKEVRQDYWTLREAADQNKAEQLEEEIKAAYESGREAADAENVEELLKVAKQKQKAQDINRIERKTWRGQARLENAIEEYQSAIIDQLMTYDFSNLSVRHVSDQEAPVGVVHLTDLHFNEQVDIPGNKYDFNVAAQRLYKLVVKAKRYFGAMGVTDVLVAFTGDLLNSDRRLDELLANADNRSRATFLAVDILQQLLMDLNSQFNVTVAGITGNESRLGKDVGWEAAVASDNFDFTIINMLRYLMRDTGITFLVNPLDPLEMVVDVNGRNFLLLHGHNGLARTSNISQNMAKKRAQYADNGIRIDFIICGHIHEALIADMYARGASIVGANSYSEKALNLSSRASQNLYLVDEDGIDGMKVDLQEADDYEGYIVQDELEENAYNSKSAEKAQPKTVIHQIVI